MIVILQGIPISHSLQRSMFCFVASYQDFNNVSISVLISMTPWFDSETGRRKAFLIEHRWHSCILFQCQAGVKTQQVSQECIDESPPLSPGLPGTVCPVFRYTYLVLSKKYSSTCPSKNHPQERLRLWPLIFEHSSHWGPFPTTPQNCHPSCPFETFPPLSEIWDNCVSSYWLHRRFVILWIIIPSSLIFNSIQFHI